jgi:AbrB family looped-hinge helix DNA binding protein
MLAMRATVSSKGQVTIPKRLRDRLGISEGSVLDFTEAGGRLVAVREAAVDPVAAVYGLLGDGRRRTDDLMRDLRGDDTP